MAIQQGMSSAAPVAKPTGGNGGNGHNCRPWNQQSSSNDSSNFQAHSAAAQSQGTLQQPQKSGNTDSATNTNNNFPNKYV